MEKKWSTTLSILLIVVIALMALIVVVKVYNDTRVIVDKEQCKYGTYIIYKDATREEMSKIVTGYRFIYETDKGNMYKIFPQGTIVDEEKHLPLLNPNQVIYCTEN